QPWLDRGVETGRETSSWQAWSGATRSASRAPLPHPAVGPNRSCEELAHYLRHRHRTIEPMIVDIHTHIFPPALIRDRSRLADLDPAVAALYRDPAAKMATVEDLLESMDAAGVDVSVACGFWWTDPALRAEHAAYLVEVAAASEGRVVPFVPA